MDSGTSLIPPGMTAHVFVCSPELSEILAFRVFEESVQNFVMHSLVVGEMAILSVENVPGAAISLVSFCGPEDTLPKLPRVLAPAGVNVVAKVTNRTTSPARFRAAVLLCAPPREVGA